MKSLKWSSSYCLTFKRAVHNPIWPTNYLWLECDCALESWVGISAKYAPTRAVIALQQIINHTNQPLQPLHTCNIQWDSMGENACGVRRLCHATLVALFCLLLYSSSRRKCVTHTVAVDGLTNAMVVECELCEAGFGRPFWNIGLPSRLR